MVGKWYKGMPPVEVVLANEVDHPRSDGITLGRISVCYKETKDKPFTVEEVKCNPTSWGQWLTYHPDSWQPYVSTTRLKVVDNVIYAAIGFTQWLPLSETNWVETTSFFPVGDNGLPIDYLPLDQTF